MTSLLRVDHVSVSFNGRAAVDEVSFDLKAGEFVGLIGPNGAGKTTLLRSIARLVPFTGQIYFQGQDTSDLDRSHLSKGIAYLAHGHTAHWPLAAKQVVALGRLPHLSPLQRPSPKDDAVINEIMLRADVTQFADRNIQTLSAGERARVMLSRALAVQAKLLLADEPVGSLDPYHQLQIMELLRELAQGGTTIVLVTHDLTLAARFCNRLILLADGKVVAEGDSGSVLSDENVAKAYRVETFRAEHDNEPFVLPWRRLEDDKTLS